MCCGMSVQTISSCRFGAAECYALFAVSGSVQTKCEIGSRKWAVSTQSVCGEFGCGVSWARSGQRSFFFVGKVAGKG